MTIHDVVLRQWKYTVEEVDWHPSLTEAVGGLTADQAAWKPEKERHSIWQIVRHITHWKRSVIERWQGESPDSDALNAADWKDVSGDQTAWERDVQTLLEVSRQIREMIVQWDDEELIRPPATSSKPKIFTEMDLCCHDAYHTGQIRYLRALQGL